MARKSWFSMQALSRPRAEGGEERVAEIGIHEEIGFLGVDARDFLKELAGLGEVDLIELSVHSPGGEVFEGWAIYNALKAHPAPVHGRVEGLAASMASVVLMACDEVEMPEQAYLMIHNPWGGAFGEAEDMREVADLLDKLRDGIVSAYDRKTALGEEAIREMMDAETWMDGSEALALGFCDRLSGAEMALAALAFDGRVPDMPKTVAKKLKAAAKPKGAKGEGQPRPEEEEAASPSEVEETEESQDDSQDEGEGSEETPPSEEPEAGDEPEAKGSTLEALKGHFARLKKRGLDAGAAASAQSQVSALTTERDQFKARAEQAEALVRELEAEAQSVEQLVKAELESLGVPAEEAPAPTDEDHSGEGLVAKLKTLKGRERAEFVRENKTSLARLAASATAKEARA